MFWKKKAKRGALILAVVEDKGPIYPYKISEEVAARTNGEVELVPGSVWVSLLRYEKRGWVDCEKLLVYDFPKMPVIVHYTLTETGCSVLERMRTRGLLRIEN